MCPPTKSDYEALNKAVNKALATRNVFSPKTIMESIEAAANHEVIFARLLGEASLSLISGIGKATERKLFSIGVETLRDCLEEKKYTQASKLLYVKSKKDLDAILEVLRQFEDIVEGGDEEGGGEGEGKKARKGPAAPKVPAAKKQKLPPIHFEIKRKGDAGPKQPQLPGKVKPPAVTGSGKAASGDLEFASEEDKELGIPLPPPPKKLKTPSISARIYESAEDDNPDVKQVLIDCKMCGKNIVVPVPKKLVLDNELPVVPVTFIHGKRQHAITLHLDHDFQVRRRRVSDIVLDHSE